MILYATNNLAHINFALCARYFCNWLSSLLINIFVCYLNIVI